MFDILSVQNKLRRFARERDWERFHNPKNLAMALAAEAGELLEQFQWLSPEEAAVVRSDSNRPVYDAVADELADVLIYLLMIADKLDVDMASAVEAKMAKNAIKYPAITPGTT